MFGRIGRVIGRAFDLLLAVTVLAIAFLVVAAFIVPGTVLPPVARFLVVREEPGHADAIVVLLGGEVPDRVLAAAELFAEGVAPRVIMGSGFVDRDLLSGAPPSLIWQRPVLRMKVALESLGVPSSAITIVDTSTNYDTSGELGAIASYLRSKDLKRVVLVTSASHSRRVAVIWRRVSGDIEGRVYGAEAPSLASWWTDSRAARDLIYEYAALVKEALRQVYLRIRGVRLDPPVPAEVGVQCDCGAPA